MPHGDCRQSGRYQRQDECFVRFIVADSARAVQAVPMPPPFPPPPLSSHRSGREARRWENLLVSTLKDRA